MCGKHWAMVPRALQRAVTESYQPGQCAGIVRPSPEWLKAAKEAILAVTPVSRSFGTT